MGDGPAKFSVKATTGCLVVISVWAGVSRSVGWRSVGVEGCVLNVCMRILPHDQFGIL